MKISRNWLKQYVRLYASAEELKRAITFLGFEVEGVENTGLPLGVDTHTHSVVGKSERRVGLG